MKGEVHYTQLLFPSFTSRWVENQTFYSPLSTHSTSDQKYWNTRLTGCFLLSMLSGRNILTSPGSHLWRLRLLLKLLNQHDDRRVVYRIKNEIEKRWRSAQLPKAYPFMEFAYFPLDSGGWIYSITAHSRVLQCTGEGNFPDCIKTFRRIWTLRFVKIMSMTIILPVHLVMCL